MVKTAYFRELQYYTAEQFSRLLDVDLPCACRILKKLVLGGVAKIGNASQSLATAELLLQDASETIGRLRDSLKYQFDYVGLVEVNDIAEVKGKRVTREFILQCYPKYIRERQAQTNDMRLVMKVIERYNNDRFDIRTSVFNDDLEGCNPLALAIFLLRDFGEYGLYTNIREELEHLGLGEIDWETTINGTISFIQGNRPYYTDYFALVSINDDSNYISRLHACLVSECSRKLLSNGLDSIFSVETPIPYDGFRDEFGGNDYIEQRILKELNVQYVTRKQILLRAMYALVHLSHVSTEDSGLQLYGTNNFNLVWEKVCAEVLSSQLETPIRNLGFSLSEQYRDEVKTLLEIIPKPRWQHSQSGKEHIAKDTLKPDLIRIITSDKNKRHLHPSVFAIMDAKYYDIKLDETKIEGQPGIADIDKQYLYQLAYKHFIDEHHLVPLNAFLSPIDTDKSTILGKAQMPIFASLREANLQPIHILLLSANKMLDCYLNHSHLMLWQEIPELFENDEKTTLVE